MSAYAVTSSGTRMGRLPNGNLNYERGTLLHIKTRDDGVLKGWVYENPMETFYPNTLTLYRVKKFSSIRSEQQGRTVHIIRRTMMLHTSDIIKIKPLAHQSNASAQLEKMYPHARYAEITTAEEFNSFVRGIIRDTKPIYPMQPITECGLNLYGKKVGVNGDVSLVCIFIKGELTALNVRELTRVCPNFWNDLKTAIFYNDNLCKVVYDATPIANYLHHDIRMNMSNVFDIHMAEMVNWCNKQVNGVLDMDRLGYKFMPLSGLLAKYLDIATVPNDIKLAKWFEAQDFSKGFPLSVRPFGSNKYTRAVEVDMRYLLSLKNVFVVDQCTLVREVEASLLGDHPIYVIPLVQVQPPIPDDEPETPDGIVGNENVAPIDAPQEMETVAEAPAVDETPTIGDIPVVTNETRRHVPPLRVLALRENTRLIRKYQH